MGRNHGMHTWPPLFAAQGLPQLSSLENVLFTQLAVSMQKADQKTLDFLQELRKVRLWSCEVEKSICRPKCMWQHSSSA